MPVGAFRNPLIYAVATLMITPYGTSQAPSTSKTVKPREASSGHASGREASSGMATGRREASSGQASGRQDQFPKASGAIADRTGDPQAPKGKAATLNGAAAPQAYKDGEDQTTRTRPGNKKTN